LHYTHWI